MSTMSRTRRSFSALVLGSALLLGACGGSSDSVGNRNRNSSMDMEACFESEEAKQQGIQAAERDLADAVDAEDHLQEKLDAVGKAKKDWDEAMRNNVMSTDEREYARIKSRYYMAEKDLKETRQKARWAESFRANLQILQERAVCGSDPTITEATMGEGEGDGSEDGTENDTTTTLADGDTSSAGGGDFTVETTTTVIGEADGTTTTLDSAPDPTETTVTSVESTTTLPETEEPVPPAPTSVCEDPTVYEGLDIETIVGEEFQLTHQLCVDPTARPAIFGVTFKTAVLTQDNGMVDWRLTMDTPGVYQASVFFMDATYNTAVSGYSLVTITVREKDGRCAGQKPELTVDVASGDMEVVRTCEAANYLMVMGKARNHWKEFWSSGPPIDDRILPRVGDYLQGQCFDIIARQGIMSNRGYFEQLGDRTVTTTGDCADSTTSTTVAPAVTTPETTSAGADDPAPTDSTDAATTTTVAEKEDIVTALPVEVMQPDDGNGKPTVISLPGNGPDLSCDSDCLVKAAEKAGFTVDQVSAFEVSLNGGDWNVVQAAFMTPVLPGGSTVRLRVTPESGEPKILSMRVVPDRIDLVKEGFVSPQAADSIVLGGAPGADAEGTESAGSSFPWLIILIVLVILAAAGETYRRRRK